jgi:hypothetical protein
MILATYLFNWKGNAKYAAVRLLASSWKFYAPFFNILWNLPQFSNYTRFAGPKDPILINYKF